MEGLDAETQQSNVGRVQGGRAGLRERLRPALCLARNPQDRANIVQRSGAADTRPRSAQAEELHGGWGAQRGISDRGCAGTWGERGRHTEAMAHRVGSGRRRNE